MVATQRIYWNESRTKLVYDGAEAAFLAYRPGDNVPESVWKKCGPVEAPQPAPTEPLDNLKTQEPPSGRKRGRHFKHGTD